MNVSKEEIGPGKLKLTISVPPEEYEKHLQKTAKRLGEKIAIAGFRKGHVPYEVVKRNIGEMELLSSALDDIVAYTLEEAWKSEGGHIALQPKVQVTKAAPGNVLEYRAEVVIAPRVLTLPELSTIAIVKEPVEVAESEVDEVIETLRNMRAQETVKEGADGKEEVAIKPELNDEFAQSLNKEFTDVAVLKQRMRESLILEKEYKELKRQEGEMFEMLFEKAAFSPIAEELIAHTADQLVEEIKARVERHGAVWSDYLNKLKKDEQSLASEICPAAEKRIKRDALIVHIAEEQKLRVSEEEVEREADAFLSQFSSLKEAQKTVDSKKLTAAVYASLLERKAVEFLKSKIYASEIEKNSDA